MWRVWKKEDEVSFRYWFWSILVVVVVVVVVLMEFGDWERMVC